MTTRSAKLSELTPDPRNANKGTQRGLRSLDESLRKYGAGRSILIDKNGLVIAGNKTLERVADIGIGDEVVIIESDGTRLIAVQRTDLDLTTDPAARELAYADNRVGQLDLDWDAEIVLGDIGAGLDLGGLFDAAAIGEFRVPDFEPVDESEQPRLDQKSPVTCPECGHEFIPK